MTASQNPVNSLKSKSKSFNTLSSVLSPHWTNRQAGHFPFHAVVDLESDDHLLAALHVPGQGDLTLLPLYFPAVRLGQEGRYWIFDTRHELLFCTPLTIYHGVGDMHHVTMYRSPAKNLMA